MNDKVDTKRVQILNAAQRCFARYGFHKTTMDDIAAVIGMKKASLYYYYKNKEAIFSDVIEREANEFFKIASEKIANEKTATQKLLCYVKTRIDVSRRVSSMNDLSLQVLLEIEPMIEKYNRSVQQQAVEFVAAIISEGVHNGEFRDCDAERVAGALIVMIESLRLREMQNTESFSAADIDHAKLENEVEYILDIFINGIKK